MVYMVASDVPARSSMDFFPSVQTNLGKPLQVMVLHSTVVAHQKCALQVLEYLEKLAHQSGP